MGFILFWSKQFGHHLHANFSHVDLVMQKLPYSIPINVHHIWKYSGASIAIVMDNQTGFRNMSIAC